MNKKLATTRLLLFLSLVLACGLAAWGVLYFWQRIEDSSTAYLTRVISELDKSQSTVARAWSIEFQTSLRALSDNSKYSEFVSRVTDLGLSAGVLQSLGGRESERKSMLSLLQARRTPEEMARIAAFANDVDSIRMDLADVASRFGFAGIYLFTRDGYPCLGTTGIPAKFQDISSTIARELGGSTRHALSTPAVMNNGLLCVDIAVPLVVTERQNVLSYSVGYLVVTVKIGDAIERMQAAISNSGIRSLVLERQPDETLIVLSSGSTQKIPLEGWEVTETSVPFALRRIHDLSADAFTVGKRLMSTNLFLVCALPEDQAQSLFAAEGNRATALRVAMAAVAFLLIVFALWLALFRSREKLLFRLDQARDNQTVRNREILDVIDRGMGLAVACLDFDNHLLFANASFARLAGKKQASDLYQKTILDLPQDLAADIGQHMALVWESAAPSASQVRLCTQQNAWQSFAVHATPYVDRDGYLSGVLVLYRNISDQTAIEERDTALVEQTVSALHRLLASMDPHAGRLTGLVAEVATLLARLDNDKSRETERLLSMAGRLCLLGNTTRATARAREQRLAGSPAERVFGISLANLDFGGLPVHETVRDMYERLDGSGLPRGIGGGDISAPARYLAIAEEACTILHPKDDPFPQDWEKALAPLLDSTKFDPTAHKLVAYLQTRQGERLLARLRRK